jgi:uncharacterized protein GlcG (DUF336 family)
VIPEPGPLRSIILAIVRFDLPAKPPEGLKEDNNRTLCAPRHNGQFSVDLAGPGPSQRDLRSRTEDFQASVVQFHSLETNVALKNFRFLVSLLVLIAPALAQAKCLGTIREIKANDVKARWRETTENDGKPLTISIADGANGLVYSAKKAGAPWLTGTVSVCRSGGATEITLKDTHATNNVPMLARLGLTSTQTAQIVNGQIILAAGGWSGTFVGL